MQPALEACVFDHGEAGAPTAAGAGGEAAAEEHAAAGPGGAAGEACAAALGQPKVALLFLTRGPMPHADVRAPLCRQMRKVKLPGRGVVQRLCA